MGVAAVLGWAAWRLGARGLAVVREGLTPTQWQVLAVLVLAFVIGEGVVALQRRWLPKVAGRAAMLSSRAPIALRVAAPAHAFGLVGVPMRVAVRAWLGVAAVVLAVLAVRALPDPWRGMIDLAVAAALAWGAVAALSIGVRLLRGTTQSLPTGPGA